MGYRAVGTNIAGKLKTKRTARIGVLILIGGCWPSPRRLNSRHCQVNLNLTVPGSGSTSFCGGPEHVSDKPCGVNFFQTSSLEWFQELLYAAHKLLKGWA